MARKRTVPQGDGGSALPVLDQEIPGFAPMDEWAKIECTWDLVSPRSGAEPFWAEISTSLTIREAKNIPEMFGPNVDVRKLATYVAPYVRSWNATARNLDTGTYEPLPPPAEAGPDVFFAAPLRLLQWIALMLQAIHLQGGPDRPKETPPSDATSDGASVAA